MINSKIIEDKNAHNFLMALTSTSFAIEGLRRFQEWKELIRLTDEEYEILHKAYEILDREFDDLVEEFHGAKGD